MNQQQVTHAFVSALVEELTRSGVRHVCIAPGSRSTPLAMLLEREPSITTWMHVDERSAAFFALGLARQLTEPVALLCTSGTAAAEFFPAVVEARYGRVPLVVLTADRPAELQEVGAPQTINQHRLYGEHVKWFADIALPEASAVALRSIRAIACRAVATALDAPAGPVHLNLPFREPLVPLPGPDPDDTVRPDARPYVEVPPSRRRLERESLEALAAELGDVERGIIVCGPQEDERFPAAVAALAAALGYPVLADPLSQVRCGPHDRSPVIAAYDAFLRDERAAAGLAPEVVLRFGAMPTSKPLLQFLERYEPEQIVVDAGAGWRDPTLLASRMLWSDPVGLCRDLLPLCAPRKAAWVERWRRADELTSQAIGALLAGLDEPFEGTVFADLAAIIPAGATLWAGSSMPVRDLDTFFPSLDRPLRFLSNRGANGIDGVVSSALGARAAGRGPVYLVIGDLSFYHDLNGLLAARLHGLDLTILLINNDGGGIFSFLPQAAHPAQFETLFGTPTGLSFEPTVAMYGGTFERVSPGRALREALSMPGAGLRVLEIATDRTRNVELHRALWRCVSQALEALTPETVA